MTAVGQGQDGVHGHGEKKADLEEMQSGWLDLRDDLYITPITGVIGLNVTACILTHSCPFILFKMCLLHSQDF